MLTLLSPQTAFTQGSGTPITGWAWSEAYIDVNGNGVEDGGDIQGGVGWISMSCLTGGASGQNICGTRDYGLSIAQDGSISGEAWSDNVGWISAEASDLVGCPLEPCTARMDEYALEGWLKVLSANDAQSGGWDGWISLSGASYGPTLTAGGEFSGYAWGSTNVGWVSFGAGSSPAATTWAPTCAQTYLSCPDLNHQKNSCNGSALEACSLGTYCLGTQCVLPPDPVTSSGDELKVTPDIITQGSTAITVSWDVQNADSCTVTENNPDFDDTWSGISGSYTTNHPFDTETIYTLSCSGLGGDLVQTATVRIAPSWEER
jgi:hypothetical protein